MTPPNNLVLPDPSLVLLLGPSGAGKSHFAARQFMDTEVVSSDRCRAWVSDDEADQSATDAAFRVLHTLVDARLSAARFTVVDATNLESRARRPLRELARRNNLPVTVVVIHTDKTECRQRMARRRRQVPEEVLDRQFQLMQGIGRALAGEGFRHVIELSTDTLDTLPVRREPLPCDRRGETGPFDVIGDIHGCATELDRLLAALGYDANGRHPEGRHPEGRRLVFLGDLGDRGPDTPGVLRRVMACMAHGQALCVQGNHDEKLARALRGGAVDTGWGLAQSIDQMARETAEFRERCRAFLAGLPHHLVLDGGRLVAAHAGLKQRYQGRDSKRVRTLALWGEVTGEADEGGLPVRVDWAADYDGAAFVAYGHTPVPEPRWLGRTVNLDTGCVFGGTLSALRYPEMRIVQVPAAAVYYTG